MSVVVLVAWIYEVDFAIVIVLDNIFVEGSKFFIFLD
jgi:hypothetical protein